MVANARRQMLGAMKRQKIKTGVSFTISIKLTKITKHQGLFEGAMISILAGCSEFSDVPWQNLSVSAKDRLRHFVGKASQMHNKLFRKELPPLVMDTFLKNPALGKITLNSWKSKRTPKRCQKIPAADREEMLVSGFFQINTGYTTGRLIDDFRDWLNVNHPKGREKTVERRGRDSKRDSLNALGALRLRYCCKTFTEAQTKMNILREKPNGMFYGDRRSFNRACKATVRHFRTLLELSDKHLPIHFTEGWQK
jgi:hypothetical protein